MELWLVLQALHVVPLPAGLVEFLSPAAGRIHALARDAGVEDGWTTLSIDPQASRVSLLKSVAYAGICFLTLALANKRSRVLRMAEVLVYAALVQSVYAVLLHLSGRQEEFFGELLRHGDMASGTYVNRNHLAGFLEMSLAIGIGLLIAGLSDRSADTWKKFVKLTIEWILSPKMVLRLSLCVLVIALTTTHSRMGNTAFFASLLIAGRSASSLSRYAAAHTVPLFASLVVIDLVVVEAGSAWRSSPNVSEIDGVAGGAESARPRAFELAKDFPCSARAPRLLSRLFLPSPQRNGAFFNQAHNDYAQFSEFGFRDS